MTRTKLDHFLKSVGYPDRVPEGSSSFTMRVDGMGIVAREANGRIVLSYSLSGDFAIIPTLCSYAAGRIMREDAVLSCDNSSAFLWQDVPSSSSEREMVRLFETFVDSCDWWRDRVDALHVGTAASSAPDDAMLIRP